MLLHGKILYTGKWSCYLSCYLLLGYLAWHNQAAQLVVWQDQWNQWAGGTFTPHPTSTQTDPCFQIMNSGCRLTGQLYYWLPPRFFRPSTGSEQYVHVTGIATYTQHTNQIFWRYLPLADGTYTNILLFKSYLSKQFHFNEIQNINTGKSYYGGVLKLLRQNSAPLSTLKSFTCEFEIFRIFICSKIILEFARLCRSRTNSRQNFQKILI